MDHLAGCICCMQMWHNADRHNKSLTDFKNKLLKEQAIWSTDDFDYHHYADELQEYCKTCKHMQPFNSGMTGCWLPAFYCGHTFCVHVNVPTFTKTSKFKECEERLYSMCVRHHAPHLWKAMCDCHNSEKSGQSKADVWMNTHGCWILCKFMITEGNECMRFHELASG